MKQRHIPEEGNPQLYCCEKLKKHDNDIHAVMMIVNILMTMKRTVTVIGMLVVVVVVMMMIMVMMVMLMAIKNVLTGEDNGK